MAHDHAALEHAVFIRDYGGLACLTASGGNGENHRGGNSRLRGGFAAPEVPDITVIGNAEADDLGRVDRAAAANREQNVTLLGAEARDAFLCQSEQRVRLDAAQFRPGKAGLL